MKKLIVFKIIACFFGVLVTIAGLAACNISKKSQELEEENPQMDANNFGPYKSKGLERTGLKDLRVLEAMSRVPRHRFVPADYQKKAYEDSALPIGQGQTISQPYIVALMTQESKVGPGSKVLEIGTGSGYQAAVLAELGAEVYSVEIIPELATKAEKLLKELNYSSVSVRTGDGWEGWPEEAPFDAIIITAASPRIPEKLLSQLAHRGKLVVPIEQKKKYGEQLLVVERDSGDFITRNLGGVKFVPLVGDARMKFEKAITGSDSNLIVENLLENEFVTEGAQSPVNESFGSSKK